MERKRPSSRRYVAREKSFGQKFKDYLRQFIAFMFSNVGIIGLVVGYTSAGAWIFQLIEGKAVILVNQEMMAIRDETVERLWNYTYTLNVFEDSEQKWTNSVATELLQYTQLVYQAAKEGYYGSEEVNNDTVSPQWGMAGAFLYSLTVITTIGYGNVTPRTDWGKIVTIFYAIIGMPLFLLYLSNIGDILARSFKWLYARCCLCNCCPKKRKKPSVGIATALKTITPQTRDLYPSRGSLQRGNSDRGPAFRQSSGMTVSRLQGSLSMEDGVNIVKGRRDLDGFGRKFKEGYGRNDDVFDEDFNERNYEINDDDYDDNIYGSQDGQSHRGCVKTVDNYNDQSVFDRESGKIRRSSSIGDINATNYSDGFRRNRTEHGLRENTMERGGSEKLRRVLKRQDEVFEMNDMGLRNGVRGGSERLRRATEKDIGLTKAELVLGMNDLGLEYLDLPKKKGRLQRVFGKSEGRIIKPEVDYAMNQLGIKDTSRFEGFSQRGSLGSDRNLYRPDVNYGRTESGSGRTNSGVGRIVPVEPVDVVTSDEEESGDEESSGGSGDSGEEPFDAQTVTVPVTLCLSIMVGYICGGAVLFIGWESDWTYLNACYFCFISLSTIGFGDIVPGDSIVAVDQLYNLTFVFCSMYLMLGMAMIAMCFNLMQEEVVHKIRSCISSLKNILGCMKRSVLPSR